MPKIRDIFSAAVEIPLARPVRWSNVSVSTREYILCWVVDDEGNFGFGYGLGSRFPRGACLMHQAIQENLKHLAVGQDPFMNEAIWNAMYMESFLIGRQGVIMRAISCIDIAIWDLKAKIVSLPLYKLLGGSVCEVPAYASGGYYQDGKDVSGLAREIQVYRSRGFTSFKIKVGHMTPELEQERVAAALDAAGPHGKVAIDANNAWKSVAEAWPYVCRFEKFNLWWLEEPFSPDNRPAYRELAKRTRIPLASGELESGRDSFRDYIEHGSAQILQTDATVVGGITEWRRVAAMAAGWNLPMAPHWVPDVHAHLLASIPNGWTAEYFLPEAGILNFEQLLENPLHVNNGIIRLNDEPGHGIRVNTDAVQTFLKAGAPPKLSSVGLR
jgi:D-arabinonate dehydratase